MSRKDLDFINKIKKEWKQHLLINNKFQESKNRLEQKAANPSGQSAGYFYIEIIPDFVDSFYIKLKNNKELGRIELTPFNMWQFVAKIFIEAKLNSFDFLS